MPADVFVSPDEPLVQVREYLRRPTATLRKIGAILVMVSRRAFLQQRLGDEVWLPRYPEQSDPFINKAGAVADFLAGRSSPLPRRFDRTPALMGTGALQGSIRDEIVGDDAVQVGTSLPYGQVHQTGGESDQFITEDAKALMRRWLSTPRGRAYAEKMSRFVNPNTSVVTTRVHQRRFLGVTPEALDQITGVVVGDAVGALGG